MQQQHQQQNWEEQLMPQELAFLTESCTMITIQPLVRIPAMEFFSGGIGPFIPPRHAQVPLWVALTLKRRGVCRIILPEWLEKGGKEKLKAHLEEELSNAEFSALPFHYYITAQLLIKEAGFDDSGGDEKVLRRLLQDLREIRQAKIRQGCQLEDFASDTTGEAYLQVNNMALMEANEIRPFLRRAFSQFNRFSLLGKINNEEFP